LHLRLFLSILEWFVPGTGEILILYEKTEDLRTLSIFEVPCSLLPSEIYVIIIGHPDLYYARPYSVNSKAFLILLV